MNSETNMSNLKEMILDEEKLVTYISVSKEFCIHINESKLLLEQVIKDLRKTRPTIQLVVNYVISGLVTDKEARTVICTENQLKEFKDKFRVVFFYHIYSINKGISVPDSIALLNTNKFEDLQLCAGGIKSSLCCKFSFNELCNLKSNNQNFIQNQPTQHTQKKAETECAVRKNESKYEQDIVTKVNRTNSEPSVKVEISSPRKQSSFNGNQHTVSKNSKTQKGIAGFFTKSNSQIKNKEKEKGKDKIIEEHKEHVKTEEKPVVTEIKSEVQSSISIDEACVQNQNTVSNTSTKDTIKLSSLKEIKKNAKVDKKRKRLLHISDSESEDDTPEAKPTVDNVSDDEIPPTPSVCTVKITSGIMNPKKKRKFVDKTFTDEDGYLLTKKEEVYESCSDNEVEHIKEEIAPKKEISIGTMNNKVSLETKKVTGKKVKSKTPQPKGKQATLMNFFKKRE